MTPIHDDGTHRAGSRVFRPLPVSLEPRRIQAGRIARAFSTKGRFTQSALQGFRWTVINGGGGNCYAGTPRDSSIFQGGDWAGRSAREAGPEPQANCDRFPRVWGVAARSLPIWGATTQEATSPSASSLTAQSCVGRLTLPSPKHSDLGTLDSFLFFLSQILLDSPVLLGLVMILI